MFLINDLHKELTRLKVGEHLTCPKEKREEVEKIIQKGFMTLEIKPIEGGEGFFNVEKTDSNNTTRAIRNKLSKLKSFGDYFIQEIDTEKELRLVRAILTQLGAMTETKYSDGVLKVTATGFYDNERCYTTGKSKKEILAMKNGFRYNKQRDLYFYPIAKNENIYGRTIRELRERIGLPEPVKKNKITEYIVEKIKNFEPIKVKDFKEVVSIRQKIKRLNLPISTKYMQDEGVLYFDRKVYRDKIKEALLKAEEEAIKEEMKNHTNIPSDLKRWIVRKYPYITF